MKRSPTPEPDDRALLVELEAIYQDAEALYGGHSCPGTTECCRFHITGREPYVTTIEVAALRRAIAARGGPLSAKKRALPIAPTTSSRRTADEGTCPLLNGDARCSVYAARPLGCRTFWCDRADKDVPVKQRTLNELVRRVRDLADRHMPGAVQGRPIRRALADRT